MDDISFVGTVKKLLDDYGVDYDVHDSDEKWVTISLPNSNVISICNDGYVMVCGFDMSPYDVVSTAALVG